MYHISNDKRSIQSSELIYNGLLECIKKKPFDQITVSDLQKASGIARSTFYRAFDNLSDVLYWKCDVCFREVLYDFKPSKFPSELELARHYFSYWVEHSDILVADRDQSSGHYLRLPHEKCKSTGTILRDTARP